MEFLEIYNDDIFFYFNFNDFKTLKKIGNLENIKIFYSKINFCNSKKYLFKKFDCPYNSKPRIHKWISRNKLFCFQNFHHKVTLNRTGDLMSTFWITVDLPNIIPQKLT